MSNVSVMLIRTKRISWNVPQDGRPSLQTLAFVSRGGNHPQPTLLGPYDQNQLSHLLAWIPLTMLTPLRTTFRPRIGLQAQYIHR